MLGHTDAEHAKKHAMRVQSTLEALAIKHEYSSTAEYVTVSQGVCGFNPTGKETPDEMYSKADEGLYRSKSEGRNRFTYID